MDVIYLIIIIITLLIEEIDSVFMKQIVVKGIQKEDFLYDAKEISLLKCVQRCKYIDKDSAVEFKGSRCRCIRYRGNENSGVGETLSGIFVSQKFVKPAKKPTIVYELKNVALNKPADQSSIASKQYKAMYANDGKGTTRSSTTGEKWGWWSVDLEGIFDIRYMIIYGLVGKDNRALRIDTHLTATDNWTLCKDMGDLGVSPRNITCSKATSARYVRVFTSAASHITIREFKLVAQVPV